MRRFLIFLACLSISVSPQLSAYANWKPRGLRYCETVRHPTNPLLGGVACGLSGYFVMNSLYEVEITSSISLGLINTGIITTDALSTEKGFWKTCKPYLVRLFDGLWSDVTKACIFMVDPLPGFPVCAQVPNESYLYRSGSGYCMKEKVCGAKVTIEFLRSPDNSSLVYSWSTADTRALTETGYIKVGNCYGYSKVLNPNKDYTTMMEEDEKNAQ
ncbi:unnamed protein product [Caenorhabditis nigoni]